MPLIIPYRHFLIVGASVGSQTVTGTASETSLGSCVIPAGFLGPNGKIRVWTSWSHTNSANNKTLKIKLGSTAFLNVTVTTTAESIIERWISNLNSTSSQHSGLVASTSTSYVTNASVAATGTEDTTTALTLDLTGTLANTGETITLRNWVAEVLRG